jgi:hypothetical protein
LVADNGVTLARYVFESLTINNNNPASAILNDARLFKLAGYQGNRRPPYSQHLRKELLGQRKDVTVDPIAGLKQPTGEAWRALHAAVC